MRIRNRLNWIGFLFPFATLLFSLAYNFPLWQGLNFSSQAIFFPLGILYIWFMTVNFGQMFSLLGNLIRALDFIPTLGSALSTLISLWLSTGLGQCPIEIYLLNPALYGWIFANAIAVVAEELPLTNYALQRLPLINDHIDFESNIWERIKFHLELCLSRPAHGWKNGKPVRSFFCTSFPDSREYRALSISEPALCSFNYLCDTWEEYMHDEQRSPNFQTRFQDWKTNANAFVSRLCFRRLACLFAFLLEIVAVVAITISCKFILSNALRIDTSFHTGSNRTISPGLAVHSVSVSAGEHGFQSFLQMHSTEICLCIALLIFSDYLWTMIRVERTFTTAAERRAWMLKKLQCTTLNYACRGAEYMENGGWIRIGQVLGGEPISVKDLPALGIVKDIEESERLGMFVLKSTVGVVNLVLERTGENMLRARLYDAEMVEQLSGQGVELREADMVC